MYFSSKVAFCRGGVETAADLGSTSGAYGRTNVEEFLSEGGSSRRANRHTLYMWQTIHAGNKLTSRYFATEVMCQVLFIE